MSEKPGVRDSAIKTEFALHFLLSKALRGMNRNEHISKKILFWKCRDKAQKCANLEIGGDGVFIVHTKAKSRKVFVLNA